MNRLLPLILRALGKLPLSFMRGLGGVIGRWSYWRRNRMAQVTQRNIARCFPELEAEQQERLAKASLVETGKLAGETLVIWSRPYTWVRQRIQRVHNLDLVKRLLAENKGLIVLGPHLGNWEVLGLYITELAPVTSLYEPPKRVQVEELVRHARQSSGAKLVPTTRKGVVALFQALQQGQISGILPDQIPNDAGGRFSEFFDQPAFTMTLIYKLMQRTGCHAVFGYAKRIENGFEIVFKAAPPELYSSDEAVAVQALNQGVAACVREAPEQYQWEYKRFRRQPHEGNFYQGIP